ncbi:hypothetical protein BJY52DRAFT_156501 [Lactarius psammicola]|nr:hypothetical protein BJY52DRAFT_156501 [Lactarius psammicola]
MRPGRGWNFYLLLRRDSNAVHLFAESSHFCSRASTHQPHTIMTHSTPETFLVWSLLACLLCIYVVYHLWSFDKLHCLRWNRGNDGGFKRFMTYNYILGMPCWVAFSVGFCVIKYSEGYVFLPEFGVIPKPYPLWSPSHQKAVFPLYLCISIAWGTEMVTHLESLFFLVFLLNAGSGVQDWFRSWYFRAWAVGSFISFVYLPLITIFTRSDLKSEVYIFFAASSWSLFTSICSMIVMSRFKPFLDRLRGEGVDMSVVVRLTKFRELNAIYIYFRTFSAIPLLLHSSDALQTNPRINALFVMDLFQVTGGFGIAISGAMALPVLLCNISPYIASDRPIDLLPSLDRRRDHAI